MLTKARQAIKRWRLAHLNRQIAKISGSSWVLPYIDEYGHWTPCVSTKPLFFTDATSLESFVHEVAHNNGAECEVSINPLAGEKIAEDEQLRKFINAAPGARRKLQIVFARIPANDRESEVAQYTILFTSKTPFEKARTTVDGSGDISLRDAIMFACDEYAKPMGFIKKRLSFPLVEPIDANEESDRRNRWELNWKNILVSTMAGLIAGLIPLVVKTALHI